MLSIANIYFRDTAQFVGILMQVWFYATPIVYPVTLIVQTQADMEAKGDNFPLLWFYQLNPMERFVQIFRDLLYDNRLPPWEDMAYCLGATIVSLGLGAWVFSRYQARIAEEL